MSSWIHHPFQTLRTLHATLVDRTITANLNRAQEHAHRQDGESFIHQHRTYWRLTQRHAPERVIDASLLPYSLTRRLMVERNGILDVVIMVGDDAPTHPEVVRACLAGITPRCATRHAAKVAGVEVSELLIVGPWSYSPASGINL